MDSNRIKELQEETAYPQSISVYKALMQVWNECQQEHNEQLRIGGVVKSLPKERPNTTSTLYPIKEKKCFWCGNKR